MIYNIRLYDVHYDEPNKRLFLIFEYFDYDLRKFLNVKKKLTAY